MITPDDVREANRLLDRLSHQRRARQVVWYSMPEFTDVHIKDYRRVAAQAIEGAIDSDIAIILEKLHSLGVDISEL